MGRAVSETRSAGRGSAGGTAQHNTVTTAIVQVFAATSKDKLTTIMIAVTFSAQSLKAIKGEGGYNTHTLHCVSFHEYEEEKRRRTLPFARTLTTHCSIKPGNEDENTETVKR